MSVKILPLGACFLHIGNQRVSPCGFREKLIASNMAKMPKMVADWRRERSETKKKMAEEKTRKDKLLAEARERFGYAVDPRSSKFLEMVAEVEKEQKKKKKLLKRRQKEEQAATPLAPADE